MLAETGCDGLLIGRAAMGNPWIFRQILVFLETGTPLPPPSLKERIEMLLRHARLLTEANGERMGVRQMRSHAAWYLKGFPNAARLRAQINAAETLSDFYKLADQCLLFP